MLKTLKNKKAEGYIDVTVAVLVIAFALMFIVSIWSMMTLKQDLKYMCGEILEVATGQGKINSAVYDRYEELCASLGIAPQIEFSAEYFDASTGKVQLGDTITVTLTHELTLQGFGSYTFPFEVTVSKSGLSKVYWK